MVKTLAINTASKTTAIALIDGKEILAEASWPSTSNEAEKLMPEIAKLGYDNLDRVVIIRGPGSFTGLRVGIAVANAIAHLQEIPVYAVDTFAYLRHSVGLGDSDKPNATIVLFAGKNEIYIQNKESEYPKPTKLDEAQKSLKGKEIYGELHENQEKALKDAKFTPIKKSLGEIITSIPEEKFEKSELVAPLYIKGPAISKPKPICFT